MDPYAKEGKNIEVSGNEFGKTLIDQLFCIRYYFNFYFKG